MNKAILQGFADEMQKDAGKLLPVTRMFGGMKRFFAGRKGAKNLYKQVSNEAAKIKKTDPNFNASSFMKERGAQLIREAKATAANMEGQFLNKGVKGQGFLGKHKTKLILGGAAAGGLYYASSMNDKDEAKRKQLAARRNLRIPQRVYYN